MPNSQRVDAIAIMGLPGSGKSTLSIALAERLGITVFSGGLVLRSRAALGDQRSLDLMLGGAPIPAAEYADLVVAAVSSSRPQVLDGSPRNADQVEALATRLERAAIGFVLRLEPGEAMRRLDERATFKRRADDAAEARRLRMQLQGEDLQRAVPAFARRWLVTEVDASRTSTEILDEVLSLLPCSFIS